MGKGTPHIIHHCCCWRKFYFSQTKSRDWNYWHSGKKLVTSLIDSGATGEFIDRNYAKSCWFNLVKLAQPILVYNVDSTANKAGSIMEVVNLILQYNNHSERTTFVVTSLGKQKLILGHSWLWLHNPKIDWIKGDVKMSRCLPCCCPRCRGEAHQERIAQKAAKKRLDICSVGPWPETDHHPDPTLIVLVLNMPIPMITPL